jgi:pilus assembly protein CpaC
MMRFFSVTAVAVVALLLEAPISAQIPAAPQAPAPPRALPAQPPPAATTAATERVTLTAGRSTVLSTEYNITRIAVTNPNVADATVVEPREVLIDGKAPGTISLIVWGDTQRTQYDIVVDAGVTNLQQQFLQLFPGEDIRVSANEEAIILSGNVSSNQIMLRAEEIAEATSAKSKVINLMQLPGGQESQQVMLQVRFAEVNSRILRELGVSLFTSGSGFHSTWGRITTQQFPAPGFNNMEATKVNGDVVDQSGELTFSDFLNIFFLNAKYDIGAVLRALQNTGEFQSLAEPNLIAYNGQEASFLAGGEIPVPVVQGGSNGAVTIQYKEFGIRLTFTPRIAGDVIRLKVAPEVSSLDFANGVTLGGFRVPALTTRRAATDVELRDGQSFAVAGLLNNISQEDSAAIPFLSKIPIIGYLFKSRAERAERTELMVLVTPRLVRALNPDEVPPLPTRSRSFLPPPGGDPDKGGTVDAPPVKKPGGGTGNPPGGSGKGKEK